MNSNSNGLPINAIIKGGHGGRAGGWQKKIGDMELDMVADMEVYKVADKVADMEVKKVADMVVDMFKTKCIKPEMF